MTKQDAGTRPGDERAAHGADATPASDDASLAEAQARLAEAQARLAEAEARASARMEAADRRMADAEALLDIASAQLSVAARNIASANAAEREYRRAVWHYTQLMKHRISNPLQTIIGMAETLREMPDLERSRRQAMIEAIGQQARVLRDISLEPRVVAPKEQSLRPAPMHDAVRMHEERERDRQPLQAVREESPGTQGRPADERPRPRSPFTRFRRNEGIDD